MKDYKANDLTNHNDEIRQVLEAEIASRYYYQKGRLESGFRNDQEVKKAIEVFGNATLYSSILRGDGIYKVIGKPGSEVQAKANSERELDEEEKN
jgi:carboxyl-terminal processing protease